VASPRFAQPTRLELIRLRRPTWQASERVSIFAVTDRTKGLLSLFAWLANRSSRGSLARVSEGWLGGRDGIRNWLLTAA
jgi:hypothetical protein